MTSLRSAFCGPFVAAVCALSPALTLSAPGDLHLSSRIDLPGVRGRLDHLAYAPDTEQLFVSALGADTVQVIDLRASRAAAQLPASEPQGVAYAVTLHRVYVANGQAGTVDAFEGSTRVAVASGLADADNLRLDERSGVLYVGYGRGVAALDMHSLTVKRQFALPAHPEGFQVTTDRIYVNVPAVSGIVVLDREAGRATATWSIAPAGANFPMAVHVAAHRLLIATRRPAGLAVLDTESGRRVAEVPICSDSDDLFVDDVRELYAICGDGHVDVIRAVAPDQYRVDQRVVTADGARTGLLVPALRRVFVAAPARNGRPAAVLIFDIE